MYQAKMIDLAKRALGIESDYGLAKVWGITPQAVSLYRAGKSRFDPYAINRISEALDKDPRELTAMIELSRNPHGERKSFWETVLKKYAGAVKVGICTALCIATSTAQDASATKTCHLTSTRDTEPLYKLCAISRLARQWMTSIGTLLCGSRCWPPSRSPASPG
jgi:hypothetical protein